MDLTDQVTVFVATVGDRANYDHCIQALDCQDSRFRFEAVENVAPMSAAFQAMIDRCETPYYVQVDEDMILEPYAIRILYDSMAKSSDDTAILCYSLWDEHMRQAILGVKIYRHAIVSQFPYRHDVPNCDTEQNDRLKAAGYRLQVYWHGYEKNLTCIGRHGVHYTPETAFEAYYNRAVKSRLFPQWMSWARRLASELKQRAAADPNNHVDLYAWLGFCAGLTADLSKLDHEKDCRTVNHDFRRLQADLETSPPAELNLHVTSKCNLACLWCPRQNESACSVTPKPDMTAKMLRVACDKCPSIRSVCIAGFGEPLLCSNLEEIIVEAKTRNLFVGLITNGVLLADYAPILKAWGVDSVSVSLNAATSDSHRACNGTDTWQRVIDGIKAAVKEMPGKVAVSMVCHRQNIDDMPAFLELAASLNVEKVDFLSLLPNDGDNADFHERRLGEVEIAAIATLKGHPEARRVRTWPVAATGTCPRACRSPYVSVSLDANGYVSPCRRVMPPGKRFGNIIAPCPPWRLPAWYNLRAALEGDRELPEVCKLCFGNYSG